MTKCLIRLYDTVNNSLGYSEYHKGFQVASDVRVNIINFLKVYKKVFHCCEPAIAN